MDLSPVFLIVVIILVMPLFVYLAVKQHKISKEVYALLAEDGYDIIFSGEGNTYIAFNIKRHLFAPGV